MRDQTNRLRWIEAGKFTAAILKKGNLFYICLYNHTNNKSAKFLDDKKTLNNQPTVRESSSFIRKQLEYLHLQVSSIFYLLHYSSCH